MRLEELNALDTEQAAAAFLACCGSSRWARSMAARRPFTSQAQLAETADAVWWSLDRADWLEAFSAHPRIGERPERPVQEEGRGGAARADATGGAGQQAPGPEGEGWASDEQSGMRLATGDVRARLADANREYEARFGYIFIVCATGKSAGEMLAALEGRIGNAPAIELRVAAEEQRRIARLRLEKLLT